MKRPTISFPSALLDAVDRSWGPLGYQNRSEFVRAAVRMTLRLNYENLPEDVQEDAPVAPA